MAGPSASLSPSMSPSMSPSKSPSVSPSVSPSLATVGYTDITLDTDRTRYKMGAVRMTYATHTFGDGTLRYASGGIPLPPKGMYGIKNQILDFQIINDPSTGIIWMYDKTHHQLVAMVCGGSAAAMQELADNSVVAPTVVRAFVWGR